jgi:hypothetical protein
MALAAADRLEAVLGDPGDPAGMMGAYAEPGGERLRRRGSRAVALKRSVRLRPHVSIMR